MVVNDGGKEVHQVMIWGSYICQHRALICLIHIQLCHQYLKNRTVFLLAETFSKLPPKSRSWQYVSRLLSKSTYRM
jgi:hypothetical protein